VFANIANNGLLDVRYDGGTGPNTDITSAISGGRLKGLIDARDTTAAGLQTSLNTLTAQLVSQVNTQHRLGYGLDGSTHAGFLHGLRDHGRHDQHGPDRSTEDRGLIDRRRRARQQCECPGVKQSANGLGGGIR
jgi:flagellar hook-associated protein FlgK